MVTEKLIVKNFGPIVNAELDLKKVTVLIGEQASGKSVLAKLVTMMNEEDILEGDVNIPNWRYNLEFFNIESFQLKISEVVFENENYKAEITGKKYKIKYKTKQFKYLVNELVKLEEEQTSIEDSLNLAFKDNDFEKASELEASKGINKGNILNFKNKLGKVIYHNLYIPAERIIIAFASFINFEDMYLSDFMEKFEERKKRQLSFDFKPLNLNYSCIEDNKKGEEEDLITIKEGVRHPLHMAASGIQSIIPMQVLIETINPIHKHLFIIEEPELNLYPNTQKELLKYLIEKCTKSDNRLIITTHSPYILTALNNLIQAHNVVKKNPEAADEVAKIVPPQYQIDFEDVGVYFIANGTAKSIMNIENQLIDANALDEVSNDISEDFGKLLQLEFQNETL